MTGLVAILGVHKGAYRIAYIDVANNWATSAMVVNGGKELATRCAMNGVRPVNFDCVDGDVSAYASFDRLKAESVAVVLGRSNGVYRLIDRNVRICDMTADKLVRSGIVLHNAVIRNGVIAAYPGHKFIEFGGTGANVGTCGTAGSIMDKAGVRLKSIIEGDGSVESKTVAIAQYMRSDKAVADLVCFREEFDKKYPELAKFISRNGDAILEAMHVMEGEQ